MRDKIIEIVENAQVASIQDAHKFVDQIIKLFEEIVPEGKVIKMPAEGIGEVVEAYYNNGFNACRKKFFENLK